MFRTAAGVAAVFASFLVVSSTAIASEGCHPVEALDTPASLPGRSAWIWADDVSQMFDYRQATGAARTLKQIGPDKWVNGEDQVAYGEPVVILKYEESQGTSGRATVKTEDGRTYVVPGGTIKLYEFWNCSAPELLAARIVVDTTSNNVRNKFFRHASTVWVRLTDRRTPVEQWGAWMRPEDVAKIDLMRCNNWVAPGQQDQRGEYPLKCQPYTVRGTMPWVSLDPKAVEVVSPTSMKIMLTN